MKIEIPYQKEHKKWLKIAYLVWTPLFPLLGEVGPKRGQKCIFADFDRVFGGFPEFTGKNECAYRVQQTKIFKNPNFQPGAKSLSDLVT